MKAVKLNCDVIREALLNLDPKELEEKATLARAARVCKAFCSPSLDILWAEMYELAPLVKLLGTSVKQSYNERTFRHVYVAVHGEPISDMNWSRFCSYTYRIRTLHLHEYQNDVNPDLLSKIFCRAGGTPLFPSLTTISLSQQSGVYGGEIMMFLAPSLRHVDVSLGRRSQSSPSEAQENAVLQFLAELHSTSPFLEDLSLSTNAHSTLKHTARVTRLRRLDVSSSIISGQSLSAYATLALLTELVIHLPRPLELDALACVGFPALQNLTTSGSPLVLAKLLGSITSMCLQAITYEDQDGEAWTMHDFRDCLVLLGSKFASTLTHVSIFLNTDHEGDEEDPLHVIPYFELLFPVCQLQDLTVELSVSIALTSRDLHIMAISWPKLTRLVIAAYQDDITPSIYALAEFARHCPNLNVLQLPVIETLTEPPEGLQSELESGQLMPHALKSMSFGPPACSQDIVELEVEDPDRVAHFIDRIFPAVEITSYACDGWDKMVELQNELQMFRRAATGSED